MIKDTLLKILEPTGPSGAEGNVARVIEEMVRPYVDEIKTDALGNLICVRRGKGKKLMFSAHMDAIGMIVADADENGFLRVYSLGGISPLSTTNRAVRFSNGVGGVVSHETNHDDPWALNFNRLFVDIGASTREEALAKVQIGSMASWTYLATEMNNRVSAPFMDDRAGCAVLVEALMSTKNSENEIIAVFSAQEEVGLRGATAAAYSQAPDMGISLDVTPTGDTPKSAHHNTKLGAGAAVKVRDGGQVCTKCVVDLMVETAENGKIPYQLEVLSGGTTDASAIQLSRGGIPAGCVSIPCRYVHSAVEMVDMGDMDACVKLVSALFNAKIEG